MDFNLDRLPQLFTAMLMTLAAVVLLGPGAPAILAQHAADRVLIRLRIKRSRHGFEVRPEPDITMKRISESGH